MIYSACLSLIQQRLLLTHGVQESQVRPRYATTRGYCTLSLVFGHGVGKHNDEGKRNGELFVRQIIVPVDPGQQYKKIS